MKTYVEECTVAFERKNLEAREGNTGNSVLASQRQSPRFYSQHQIKMTPAGDGEFKVILETHSWLKASQGHTLDPALGEGRKGKGRKERDRRGESPTRHGGACYNPRTREAEVWDYLNFKDSLTYIIRSCLKK